MASLINSLSSFQLKTVAGACLSTGASLYLGPLSWIGLGAVSAGGQMISHGIGALAKRCSRSVRRSQRSITDVDQVVAKIKELKKTNKICLFIGKQPHESLPAKQDGTIWVSLDQGDIENTTTDRDRLHLKMDGNNDAAIDKIKGLFHEVVFDHSTWSFFGCNEQEGEKALLRFSKLLDPSDRDATLITDFCKSMIGEDELRQAVLDVLVQRKRAVLVELKQLLTDEQLAPLYEEARLEYLRMPESEQMTMRRELRSEKGIFYALPSQMKKVSDRSRMLRRYFENVVRETYRPHPYPHCNRSDQTHYILNGFKSNS